MEILELIKNLELELLTYECRHNSARIDELLADDFFECGKSGDRFGKQECLDALPNESKDKIFEASEMAVMTITDGVIQTRFICKAQNPGEDPIHSFRTSLWKNTPKGWQMFFHQGTLLNQNPNL